jgi:hypothetical protein
MFRQMRVTQSEAKGLHGALSVARSERVWGFFPRSVRACEQRHVSFVHIYFCSQIAIPFQTTHKQTQLSKNHDSQLVQQKGAPPCPARTLGRA